jgi:hypothetical protein
MGGRVDIANRGNDGFAVSAVLPASTDQNARFSREQAGVS